jgi:DNA-binding winged helix-turn-helix (wHTH) protein
MKEFTPFRLDPANQCLWHSARTERIERVVLPPKAFTVLQYLVDHAGRLVTLDEFLDAIWPGRYVQPQVLKSQIFEIRKALGDDAWHPRYIETAHRRGYRFIAEVLERTPTNARAPSALEARVRSCNPSIT